MPKLELVKAIALQIYEKFRPHKPYLKYDQIYDVLLKEQKRKPNFTKKDIDRIEKEISLIKPPQTEDVTLDMLKTIEIKTPQKEATHVQINPIPEYQNSSRPSNKNLKSIYSVQGSSTQSLPMIPENRLSQQKLQAMSDRNLLESKDMSSKKFKTIDPAAGNVKSPYTNSITLNNVSRSMQQSQYQSALAKDYNTIDHRGPRINVSQSVNKLTDLQMQHPIDNYKQIESEKRRSPLSHMEEQPYRRNNANKNNYATQVNSARKDKAISELTGRGRSSRLKKDKDSVFWDTVALQKKKNMDEIAFKRQVDYKNRIIAMQNENITMMKQKKLKSSYTSSKIMEMQELLDKSRDDKILKLNEEKHRKIMRDQVAQQQKGQMDIKSNQLKQEQLKKELDLQDENMKYQRFVKNRTQQQLNLRNRDLGVLQINHAQKETKDIFALTNKHNEKALEQELQQVELAPFARNSNQYLTQLQNKLNKQNKIVSHTTLSPLQNFSQAEIMKDKEYRTAAQRNMEIHIQQEKLRIEQIKAKRQRNWQETGQINENLSKSKRVVDQSQKQDELQVGKQYESFVQTDKNLEKEHTEELLKKRIMHQQFLEGLAQQKEMKTRFMKETISDRQFDLNRQYLKKNQKSFIENNIF